MTKKELIEKIKDKLLKNAIAEYQNGIEDCGDYVSKNRNKYRKEDQRLYEERTYLMQDYEDIMHNMNFKQEELNFNYD